MSGFAHLTGQPDGPPTLPAFGLADSIAGIAATAAVAMALYQREKDGRGQEIDVDLLTPIMTAVGPGVIYADQLGIDQNRTGNRSLNNAPRNTYETQGRPLAGDLHQCQHRSPSGCCGWSGTPKSSRSPGSRTVAASAAR